MHFRLGATAFGLLLLASGLLTNCKNRKGQELPVEVPNSTAAVVASGPIPADFVTFYEKFHRDSLYQMAHIAWPLQGETTIQKDTMKAEKKTIYWEKNQWKMHRTIDFSTGEFKQTLTPVGDGIVMEVIKYSAANFGLERRFAKNMDGEWELIFYSDMAER